MPWKPGALRPHNQKVGLEGGEAIGRRSLGRGGLGCIEGRRSGVALVGACLKQR